MHFVYFQGLRLKFSSCVNNVCIQGHMKKQKLKKQQKKHVFMQKKLTLKVFSLMQYITFFTSFFNKCIYICLCACACTCVVFVRYINHIHTEPAPAPNAKEEVKQATNDDTKQASSSSSTQLPSAGQFFFFFVFLF